MRDFTFSDGTRVKKGQTVSVAARPMHFDEAIYPRAGTFDGFRFYDANVGSDEQLHLPNRIVSTSTEFLTFGTGRHAWCAFTAAPPVMPQLTASSPGRFWAADGMKAGGGHVGLRGSVDRSIGQKG